MIILFCDIHLYPYLREQWGINEGINTPPTTYAPTLKEAYVLTLKQIKAKEPKAKDFKLYDEKELFLPVKKNGSKYWRFKYHFNKKEKLAIFRTFTEVSYTGATLSIRNKNGEDNTIAEFHAPSSERNMNKRTWYALRELFAAAFEDQKESKSLIDKLPWWYSY